MDHHPTTTGQQILARQTGEVVHLVGQKFFNPGGAGQKQLQ